MSADATTATATLKIRPLGGLIGAEIEGVDLSRDIPSHVAAEIRAAFAQYFVLVLRNARDVGAEEQHRLAAIFGTPEPLAHFQFLGAMDTALTINAGSKIGGSNASSGIKAHRPARHKNLQGIGISGEFDGWHSDSTFLPWLPRAAVLRAEIIPPVGGDTGFTSLCAAYDALSPTVQTWLADLKAVHIVPDGYKDGINIDAYGPDAEARFDAEYPPREWPLVIAHPETGRKALFANPSYTVHVSGLKRAESHALLRFLFHHVMSASFIYSHHWRPGDLVVWDEVTALHRAPNDFGDHPRKVLRVTAGRAVPTAPPRDA